MMYSKIINNKPVGKYSQEFVDLHPEEDFAPFYEGDFVIPIWNGVSYEESATAEEIEVFNNEKKQSSFDLINEYFVKLHVSALSKVTGKSGSFDYLRLQKEEYDIKYKVSLEVLNNQTISFEWMFNQMNLEKDFEDFAGEKLVQALSSFGLSSLDDRLKDFCQIVKFRYEYAQILLNDFLKKITFMRTRLITDVELGHFNNYQDRILIVEYVLKNNLTPQEINEKFIDFVNIGL